MGYKRYRHRKYETHYHSIIRYCCMFFLSLQLIWSTCGQSTILKTVYHLNKQMEFQYGYAEAVKAGTTIYISATFPKDVSGSGIYPNAFQMETQIRKVYGDLKVTLNHFGLNFNNVIEENIYTTDMGSLMQAMYIRSEFISSESKMTSTWIQIYSLLDPTALVAVSMVAELGDSPQTNVFYLHESLEQQHGMAHAVLVKDLLRTSSTQSLDDWGNVLYPYDYTMQITKVYTDLTTTLAHFGLSWKDVILERVFVCNMFLFKQHLPTRATVLNNHTQFAIAWTEVVAMSKPGLVLSVNIEAYAGSGKRKVFSMAHQVEQQYGFIQAVQAGPYLCVSGTQSIDGNGVVVGLGDMWGQVSKVYADISMTLGQFDADWNQVVLESTYTLDLLALGWASGARFNFLNDRTNLSSVWLKTAEMVFSGTLLQTHILADLRLESASQAAQQAAAKHTKGPVVTPSSGEASPHTSFHFLEYFLIVGSVLLFVWLLALLVRHCTCWHVFPPATLKEIHPLVEVEAQTKSPKRNGKSKEEKKRSSAGGEQSKITHNMTVMIPSMEAKGLQDGKELKRGRSALSKKSDGTIDWTSRRSDSSPLTLFRMDQMELANSDTIPTIQPSDAEDTFLLESTYERSPLSAMYGAISINEIISPDLIPEDEESDFPWSVNNSQEVPLSLSGESKR